MKWALEGQSTKDLPPEVRDYKLVTLTGRTFDQIDLAEAARCDWLIAIDNTVAEVIADQRKKVERERADRRR